MWGIWGSGTPWGTGSRLWGMGSGRLDVLFEEYHAALGNLGLILHRDGYERRLNSQHAAQLSTSGVSDQDRLGKQALLITGWQGGEGTLRHQPATPSRYRAGSGIDIFSESGAVGLGPHMALLQATAFNELRCGAVYAGKLWVGTSDGKVYSLTTGGTWTLERTTGKTTGGITAMTRFANKLLVGNGEDGVIEGWDGSSWATAYTIPNTLGIGTVTGIHCLVTHYIDTGGQIPFFSASGSTGFSYVGYPDSTTTAVGAGVVEPRVHVMRVMKNRLVMIGSDAANLSFRVYSFGDAATPDLRYHTEQEGDYILCGDVLDERLWMGGGVDGSIWTWDDDELIREKALGSDVNPYTTTITGMKAWRGGIWISILDEDGSVGLLRDNGSNDWSRPVTGLSGTTPGPLVEFNKRLHLFTQATGAARLYGTDGTFRATGQVESALIDAKLGGADKLWLGMTVQHSALVAGQSVELQYKLEDTGSWVSLGTSDVDGATSASFDFATGVTANLIAFKILLTGAAAGSSSPLKVYEIAGRYLPADGTLWEWSLAFRLDGTTDRKFERLDGTDETLTGQELAESVRALIEAEEPVAYLDIDGEEYVVHVTDYAEKLAPSYPQIAAKSVGYDLAGTLRLVEVG